MDLTRLIQVHVHRRFFPLVNRQAMSTMNEDIVVQLMDCK